MPTLEAEKTDVQAEVAEIIAASERARDAMFAISAEVDRTGDSAEAMRIAWQAGIHRLTIPTRFGGLSTGDMLFQLEAAAKALLNVAEGEQSCGQMLGTQFLLLRSLFVNGSDVSEEVQAAVAASLLEQETRVFAAGNVTGVPGNGLTMVQVEGGVRVNGTVGFATQSNGEHGFVQLIGWIRPDGEDSDWTMATAFTRLGDPGVRPHNDWDNMGQRATGSGRMSFDDVFVPDGWWHLPKGHGAGGIGGTASFAGYPAIAIMMLGMGLAAYRAEIEYLEKIERPAWPLFENAKDDVTIHLRLGKHRTALAAAKALVLQAARDSEHADEHTDVTELHVQAAMARTASTEAALYVAADVFALTGARSTTSKYDMDRFWRNTRTLSTHDPIDVEWITIGSYAINGKLPEILGKRMAQAFRKPTK